MFVVIVFLTKIKGTKISFFFFKCSIRNEKKDSIKTITIRWYSCINVDSSTHNFLNRENVTQRNVIDRWQFATSKNHVFASPKPPYIKRCRSKDRGTSFNRLNPRRGNGRTIEITET